MGWPCRPPLRLTNAGSGGYGGPIPAPVSTPTPGGWRLIATPRECRRYPYRGESRHSDDGGRFVDLRSAERSLVRQHRCCRRVADLLAPGELATAPLIGASEMPGVGYGPPVTEPDSSCGVLPIRVVIVVYFVLFVGVVVSLALCRAGVRDDDAPDRRRGSVRWRAALLQGVRDRRRTARPGSPERRSRQRPWG
jgi:hypothetical protein